MTPDVDRPGLSNDRPDHEHGVREIGTEDGKIPLAVRQVVSFSVVSDSGEFLCLDQMVT